MPKEGFQSSKRCRYYSTNIIETVNNLKFEIEFQKSLELTNKHIPLTFASLYFFLENHNITTSYFFVRIFGLMTFNIP